LSEEGGQPVAADLGGLPVHARLACHHFSCQTRHLLSRHPSCHFSDVLLADAHGAHPEATGLPSRFGGRKTTGCERSGQVIIAAWTHGNWYAPRNSSPWCCGTGRKWPT